MTSRTTTASTLRRLLQKNTSTSDLALAGLQAFVSLIGSLLLLSPLVG